MRISKKHFGIAALASVAILTGCQQDDNLINPEVKNLNGKAMSFRVLTGKTDVETRGLIQTGDLINGFKLYSAYVDDRAEDSNKQPIRTADKFADQDGNIVVRKGALSTDWDAMTPVYWPQNDLAGSKTGKPIDATDVHYYAFSYNGSHVLPASFKPTIVIDKGEPNEIGKDIVTLPDFVLPHDKAQNGDLLAVKAPHTSSDGTAIALEFKHILSAITFTFTNEANNQNAVVLIKGLTLKDFNTTGTYTFENDGLTTAKWDDLKTPADFAVLNSAVNDPNVVVKGFVRKTQTEQNKVKQANENDWASTKDQAAGYENEASYAAALAKAKKADEETDRADAAITYPSEPGKEAFFVIPQTFNKSGYAKLTVNYSIKRGPKDEFQDNTETFNIGKDTDCTFKPGNKYNLVLKFSDANGTSGINGGNIMSFDISVSDYADKDNKNNPNIHNVN